MEKERMMLMEKDEKEFAKLFSVSDVSAFGKKKNIKL